MCIEERSNLNNCASLAPTADCRWDALPPGVIENIVRLLPHSPCASPPVADLRLVCRAFRHALPLGHRQGLKVWSWEPEMAAAVSKSTTKVHITAPLLEAKALAPFSAAFGALRSLCLDWAALPALRAAAPHLAALEHLAIFSLALTTGGPPLDGEHCLTWAAALTRLTCLEVGSSDPKLTLHDETALASLAELQNLRKLVLDGCSLPLPGPHAAWWLSAARCPTLSR